MSINKSRTRQLALACLFTVLLVGCKDKVNQAAIDAGKVIAQKGNGTAAACMSCHGNNGEGNSATGFPRLAGLNAAYLERQLQDFARDPVPEGVVLEPIARDYSKTPRIYSDKTVFTPGMRQDPIMSGIAKGLTDADRKNLAAYYASLGFTAKPVPVAFEVLERGEDLALRGKPEYGLPACVSCHAPDGEGFGAEFPPLAGQPAEYLISQINRWQSGARDNDPMGLMKAIADQLTDADKMNAAAFYANRSLSVKGE